jgi:hypothetical protein
MRLACGQLIKLVKLSVVNELIGIAQKDLEEAVNKLESGIHDS